MKALILATASVLALGIAGTGAAYAWGYSGSTMSPHAQSYNYQGSNGYYRAGSYSRTGQTYAPRQAYAPSQAYAPNAPYQGPMAVLTRGQVAQAQMQLARAGDYRGPIDGLIGPMTSDALMRFQMQHGLPPTGGFNHATMAGLGIGAGPATGSTPYVYQGSSYHPAPPSASGGSMGPRYQPRYGRGSSWSR